MRLPPESAPGGYPRVDIGRRDQTRSSSANTTPLSSSNPDQLTWAFGFLQRSLRLRVEIESSQQSNTDQQISLRNR
jgi:hypothetical protein